MIEKVIIHPVTNHTDWCSSITYAIKKDGSLHVCLDPQKLNQALKRCPHKIPTVEKITPAFMKAKYFTKLDAKAGHWSVRLAPTPQDLHLEGAASLTYHLGYVSARISSRDIWTDSLINVKVSSASAMI